jgi:predicted MFS family arabinose efflux permease
MGIFDIVGTTVSGWLTDRYSSRYLLFSYYFLRGISLLCLPYTLSHGHSQLKWFAVFYGLDWVATVPPTVRLTADLFGRNNAGVIFGWIAAAHQLGAALAALSAGVVRTSLGDYSPAFWISGGVCFLAGISFLFTRRLLDQRPSIAATTGPPLASTTPA